MIKRILIPLDNSKYCDSAIATGCYMARYYGAELTAITVLDIPGIENSVGPVPMGGSAYAKELREHKKKAAHETLEEVLAKFKEKCKTENVQHRVLQESGEPAEEIVSHAILYDLVVMGLKTFFHFGTSDEPGETIDKLLEQTVTPGIAVPEDFPITGKEMNVLIAFDGSLPAARALRQFGRRLDPEICNIKVINAGDDLEKCKHVLERAENYLVAHNFKKIEKIYTPGKIISVIDEQHHDWADLIVVGLHSKKGFFDKFIGSLCRHLIQRADKALFLGA